MSTSTSETGAGASAGVASRKILQLHRHKKQYRGHSGVSEKDFIADFLFSVRPAEAGAGEVTTFWCEVQLKRELAERGSWKDLSKNDRFKALYCFAVDAITKAGGRAVRRVRSSSRLKKSS